MTDDGRINPQALAISDAAQLLSKAGGRVIRPEQVEADVAAGAPQNPGPFTLRELVWMADAKQTDHWNHTAAVLAMTANTHRDPKKTRPFKPGDFHPATKRSQQPQESKPKVDITILKMVFVDRGPFPR